MARRARRSPEPGSGLLDLLTKLRKCDDLGLLAPSRAELIVEVLRENGITVTVKNGLLDPRRAERLLDDLEENRILPPGEEDSLIWRPTRIHPDVSAFLLKEKRGLLRYFALKAMLRVAPRASAAVPTWPRDAGVPARSGANRLSPTRTFTSPEHDETVRSLRSLCRDLWSLHYAYLGAIEGAIGHYIRLQKKAEPGQADDPVVALAESVRTSESRVAPTLAAISERMVALDRMELPAIAPVAALRQEVDRLWGGVPYARAWLVFIEHVLLALAVAFVLRQKAWKTKRGAQVASLVAALRSLGRLPDSIPEGLPVGQFGLARSGSCTEPVQHVAGEHEYREALEATLRSVLSPAKTRGRKPRVGRLQIIAEAANALGLTQREFVESVSVLAALEGWGHLPLVDLYRKTLAGEMAMAFDRMADRALDEAGKEIREISSSPCVEDQDLDRHAKGYEKQTGRRAITNGKLAPGFRKFLERRTRYTGRRVGFEIIPNPRPRRPRSDEGDARIERDEKGFYVERGHHVPNADDIPSSSASMAEPDPAPDEVVAYRELCDLLAADPRLHDYVKAALDDQRRKAIGGVLGITEDGAKKRKARLRSLLKQHGYSVLK